VRFAIESPAFGELAEPDRIIELAVAAEAAGWEGLFLWDHLFSDWSKGVAVPDPWVLLTAVAARTERLVLGTDITPIPRHHPFPLARMLTTVDRLSHGRVILGAGLGSAEELGRFGFPTSDRERAAITDATLDQVGRWMAGEEVDGVLLAPLPVQRPRVPIWIGGRSAPALRRASRWDGWVISAVDEHGAVAFTPEQVADGCERIGTPVDIAITGVSEPGAPNPVRDYEQAGATWWLETLHGYRADYATLLRRVHAGPPTIS
jgi:alkanesulfonate monooxygenase SsuD/methylene tetrahydromethanopterin reductase-like flavin-dependent oxidoreductase (luciferase family)